ncbi:MAG: hypothetical protein P8X98_17450 [Woeseiaceae bacterium]
MLACSSICAQTISTPEIGDPERDRILDAARAPVESALGAPVLFRVDTLRSDDRWAFLTAVPVRSDGSRIDYSGTPYAHDIEAGFFEDWVCALLRREKGRWAVVELEIGATDVPFADWPEEYGAPEALFNADSATTQNE